MPLFVVVNEQGPRWTNGRTMQAQDGWSEHVVFMNALESERFVVLGGPLGGGPHHRALLVVQGANEAEVRARLAEDPWMRHGVLRNVSVDPWELLLGSLR